LTRFGPSAEVPRFDFCRCGDSNKNQRYKREEGACFSYKLQKLASVLKSQRNSLLYSKRASKMIPSKLLFLFSFILVPAFGLPSCCEPEHDSTKNQRVLDDYLDIWSGNLTLAETVFHPDVVLHSDRFPSSTGKGSDLISVTNRDEFVAFVQRSRKGWKRYTFTPIRSTGDGESVAVRWAMHGVIGSNFTLFPT
jgi:hypothetical protein